MKGLLQILFLIIWICVFHTESIAQKTWLGNTSAWEVGTNWSPSGVPSSSDDVQIGIAGYTTQPVLTGAGACKSIKFGPSGPSGTIILTVNGGTLSVGGSIQQNYPGLGNLNTTITGTGTITCTSLTVGDNQAPSLLAILAPTGVTTVKSNIAQLTINGALTAQSASTFLFSVLLGSLVPFTNNAIFSVANDNAAAGVTTSFVTVTGAVTTTNVTPLSSGGVIAHANITLNNIGSKKAVLQLKSNDPIPVNSINTTYNGIDFYVPGAGTGRVGVEYAGADQVVYTDNTVSGIDVSPSVYQDILFSGTGTKTATGGNLTIHGDWTSNSGSTVSVTSPSVIFQGTGTETLTDKGSNSGVGVVFKNVTFLGDSIKTITGATGTTSAFSVSSTGVLTMGGTKSHLDIGANGKLTLLSGLSSTATVDKIPTNCRITGNVSVQRYFKGGTVAGNYRYYRLLSSPINLSGKTDNRLASAYFSLAYLSNNPGLFTAGIGGASNGFTVTNASPTIFLYKENLPASNGLAFNNGNYKGLANITGSPVTVYNDAGTLPNVTTTLYTGNGFMLYYAGDNVHNVTSTTVLNKQFRVGNQYVDPEASVTTTTGTLNQGSIPVRLWWNTTNTTLSKVVSGFNLMGNPYASTIDWETFSNSSSSAGIYAPAVYNTVYTFNYTSKNYGTYQVGGASTNNGSRYIASGQGFFVKASGTGASLTFNEAAKVTTQPTGAILLMGLPVQTTAVSQILRIKLAKDSVNTDETAIVFDAGAQDTYDAENDVLRLNGIANVTSMATYAKEGTQQLAINHLHSIDSTTRVKLYVNSTGDAAINTLTITGFSNLDPRYDAFLIDHYKNDSLQISLYGKYDFNLNPAVAASFGDSRFELVFHKKSGLNYRLLSFNGTLLNSDIQLKWTTQFEQNLTGFAVEKADGAGNYNQLFSIQSNGSGTYTWLDKTPTTGINTYRLKQIDAFDHTTYSKLVSVDLTPSGNVNPPIMVYPNPAVAQFNLKVTTPVVPNQMLMRVIGLNGQTLISKIWSGSNTQQSVNNLLPGTYIVEVTDNNTKQLVGRVKISKP